MAIFTQGVILRSEQRSEPELPLADGLVCHSEAPFEQQLGNVAEAQLVTQAPQHGEQDDVVG